MEKILLIASMALALVEAIVLYRIYRKETKEATEKEEKETKRIQDLIPYFIHQVELAETLDDVFLIHIRIWGSGIHHENFGPDKYGIFRTDDIMTMSKTQVFLGNINGLWTETLPFWKGSDNEQIVLNQYKRILISGLNALLK